MGIDTVKSVSSYAEHGSSSSTAQSQAVSATTGASTSVDTTPSVSEAAAAVAESSSEQSATGRESGQASNQQIRQAVDKINHSAVQSQSEAVFGIHEDTNRVTIKIVDKDTKEVIREYPPEKTLDMIAKVWEMAGLFVDEKR